jgi:hypothetical protein
MPTMRELLDLFEAEVERTADVVNLRGSDSNTKLAQKVNRIKALEKEIKELKANINTLRKAVVSETVNLMTEETYSGNEFYETYGVMWYNVDEQLDEAE